jgi:hypothetical protein
MAGASGHLGWTLSPVPAAVNDCGPVIAPFAMWPAMCSPFQREFRPPSLHLDGIPLPALSEEEWDISLL